MSTSKIKFIKHPVIKIIFWFIIGIFIFFILFTAAIQVPFVQTRVVKELSKAVSDRIQYPVTIDHVNLDWFDELKVEGLLIYDLQQNLMIGVNSLLVDFDITTLISINQIRLDQATFTQADVNLTKYSLDEEINIGGFIKSIKKLVNAENKRAKRDFLISKVLFVDSRVKLNNIAKDSIEMAWTIIIFF